jgi:hypothetical protein
MLAKYLYVDCMSILVIQIITSDFSSGDSELDRVSLGWITSPLLSKFGGSYPQGLQTCPFSVLKKLLQRDKR